MIDVLCFFHNCYMNIKTPLDETVYMEKMSHLLTMYMDMEIKASRRGKENVKRITSKVISALFIILNNSSEYILDTILKARFTVKSYSEICIPIFKRVVSLAVSQDLTYVRCLLVFKLWKRLVPRGEERNSLNRLAVSTLSPPPPQLLEMVKRGMLKNVLPTLPPNKKPALVTRFYMTSKFNLRESIKAFLKISSEFKLNELSSILDTSRFFDEPFEQESFLLSGKDTSAVSKPRVSIIFYT
ncbi:uncharacterized protein LOC124363311 [Homalodisca vitripennis]|uniref:uncharacterized protein LOC124363311 n=1 Tax=Homalodisca vitripennis TaxID=197043 RepID=UPI001EEB58B8|nr:uncharacterized protein LOC124363311 [Homalodisca vitripennis]